MNINDEVFALTWAADELFRREGIENRLPVIRKIDGPWTRLCDEISWKSALALSTDVARFSQALEGYKEAILAEIKDLEPGQRTVIADDICSGAGWLLDPTVIKSTLLPLYQQFTSAFDRTLGFHSDGNISELFADLEEVGFSFVHLASINYVELEKIVISAQNHALDPFGGISTETISAGPLSDELRTLLGGLVADHGLIVTDDAGLKTPEQLDAFLFELSAIPLY